VLKAYFNYYRRLIVWRYWWHRKAKPYTKGYAKFWDSVYKYTYAKGQMRVYKANREYWRMCEDASRRR